MDYKRMTTRNEKGEWAIELNEEEKWLQRELPTDEFIMAMFDLTARRLAELEDKIENGTLVELPCKVGDTVYAISESRIEECCCRSIFIDIENNVETDHHCDYECKGCPFNSWGQDYSGEYSCQGEYGVWLFKFEDFGKTVFLTKAEAEAKLRELKGDRE